MKLGVLFWQTLAYFGFVLILIQKFYNHLPQAYVANFNIAEEKLKEAVIKSK